MLEVEGPSKTVYLYRPEILVQNAEFKNLYKKIADASVTISARSSSETGKYKFTYVMEDKERNVKERIKFSVEIIAPEDEDDGLFGSTGSSSSSRSSSINSGGGSSSSGSSADANESTGESDSGSSSGNETENGS